PYALRVPLWATSYAFMRGHRVRLAVACADFPRLWPTARSPRICVHLGGHLASTLRLPVVPDAATRPIESTLARPEEGIDRTPWVVSGAPSWRVLDDKLAESVEVQVGIDVALALP